MDVFHLLSAVAGGLAGLMLYAVVTPGQLPTGSALVENDPRADLLLVGLHGRREADGFMHVRGAIANGRDVPCRLASVTVKFVSEQVNVTTDAGGKTVDGDASQVTTVTDIWTFSRNTRTRDPNWSLVATRSPN